MAIKKVLSPAIIERTNQTYPEYRDILCLVSHFDTMQISFDTYKIHNVKCLFPISDKEAEKRRSVSMEITYDEAVILRNKLQEFINAYDEYAKYNFMVGEHESLISDEDDDCSIDIPLPFHFQSPDLPKFTDVQDVDLGDKSPVIKLKAEDAVKLFVDECNHLGIPYTYKNPEIQKKVEAMINLAR